MESIFLAQGKFREAKQSDNNTVAVLIFSVSSGDEIWIKSKKYLKTTFVLFSRYFSLLRKHATHIEILNRNQMIFKSILLLRGLRVFHKSM